MTARALAYELIANNDAALTEDAAADALTAFGAGDCKSILRLKGLESVCRATTGWSAI
jgi:hypothetical protein